MTDKSNIVAFSGAHGTGKTTSVFSLAKQAKIDNSHNGNIGVIMETSRMCPLPVMSAGCNQPSEAAQEWIFARQLQQETEMAHKFGLVISDRTLVDCAAYTRFFKYDALADAMESVILARKPYREVFFKTILNNPYCVYDGFRNTNILERAEIEHIMLNAYKRLNIDVEIDRSWMPK